MLGVALQNLEDSRFTEMPAAVAECRMLALSPLKTALTELSAKAGADTESTGGQRADAAKIAVAKAALTSLLDTLETMTPESVANGETILWLTRGRDGDQEPRLYTAPLDVAGKLANRLWNEHAIIATSATLKLGGTFAPLMHKMGLQLDTPKPETLDVGSPFRHDRQGILYLARDLPAPTRGSTPTCSGIDWSTWWKPRGVGHWDCFPHARWQSALGKCSENVPICPSWSKVRILWQPWSRICAKTPPPV